jgi:RNA polymerase sigma-70 factor (ECF subfamily)
MVRARRRGAILNSVTMTIGPDEVESGADLAARFARDAAPLFDVLARRARRLTYCDADAEDLLQDTLLHAFTGFRSFQEGTNLKAWLFRILHNRWVSTHRYRERRPTEVPVDEADVLDLVDGDRRRRPVETEIVDAMPDDDVRAALATLPEGVRSVMYCAGVQGYTYAETAALLNIPVGTVMSRVSRGRQRLRIALAHRDHRPAATLAEQCTA